MTRDLQWLLDEAALRSLLARYGQILDWLEWDSLDTIFWPGAQLDFGMFKGDYAAYRDFVVALEEGYRRRLHMFAMPTIRIDGASARIDAGSIILCRTDNDAHGVDDAIYGRYVLRAERRDGVWKFIDLVYLLNLFDHRERDADDRSGPMNMADDTTLAHPLRP